MRSFRFDAAHPEVLYQFEVLLGVARRGRHHGGAQLLHPVVGAEAAGEEAVAIRHGEGVAAPHAISGEGPRHAFRPYLQVAPGVAHDGGIARGARRGMHAHYLRRRCGLQAVGIVVAQVLLGGEGQFCDVVDRMDVGRGDVHGLHLLTVEGHVAVHQSHQFLQPLALQMVHLVAAHALLVLVPNHYLFTYLLEIYPISHSLNNRKLKGS